MATTHETLELGIIPHEQCEISEDNMSKELKNAEDVCSGLTPMNTPAIKEDDQQPIEPEDIQPDWNATNSVHSEHGNITFCNNLVYAGV